jgi:hypothetical protein
VQEKQDHMTAIANEHRRPLNYKTGDKVLIIAEKLPVSYGNVTCASRKL